MPIKYFVPNSDHTGPHEVWIPIFFIKDLSKVGACADKCVQSMIATKDAIGIGMRIADHSKPKHRWVMGMTCALSTTRTLYELQQSARKNAGVTSVDRHGNLIPDLV